jgi:FdhD protein
MTSRSKTRSIIVVETQKINGQESLSVMDSLSVEEPLEIWIETEIEGDRQSRVVAVTMRTPGNDSELAAGFLFTEGIISSPADIDTIEQDEKCNVVKIALKQGVKVDMESLNRHSFVASSCGVCGKKSIAAVVNRHKYQIGSNQATVKAEIISSLPDILRKAQSDFDTTGGIHASALFDLKGKLLVVREDVGRHNALDKLIATQLLNNNLPLSEHILLLSGRASFELVQKAAHAGIAILAAVGAPSSLAVQLAAESGMTLIGFVRGTRFNIYTGIARLPEFAQAKPDSASASKTVERKQTSCSISSDH